MKKSKDISQVRREACVFSPHLEKKLNKLLRTKHIHGYGKHTQSTSPNPSSGNNIVTTAITANISTSFPNDTVSGNSNRLSTISNYITINIPWYLDSRDYSVTRPSYSYIFTTTTTTTSAKTIRSISRVCHPVIPKREQVSWSNAFTSLSSHHLLSGPKVGVFTYIKERMKQSISEDKVRTDKPLVKLPDFTKTNHNTSVFSQYKPINVSTLSHSPFT